MCPLSCQQRPWASLSPALVGTAVFPLAVTVMVVPSPTGTKGRIHLQHVIDDLQRINDQWIVGPPNSVSHQLQKPAIDHLPRLKDIPLPGSPIGDSERPHRNTGIVERLSWARR